jgi:hypothetical protein
MRTRTVVLFDISNTPLSAAVTMEQRKKLGATRIFAAKVGGPQTWTGRLRYETPLGLEAFFTKNGLADAVSDSAGFEVHQQGTAPSEGEVLFLLELMYVIAFDIVYPFLNLPI